MITEVKERKVTDLYNLNYEYEGKWVVFYGGDFPNEPGKGYVVAYGDGSNEDRDALREYLYEKYNGNAFLQYGYVPKEDVVLGMYDIGVADPV